jgi:hypothetical protein
MKIARSEQYRATVADAKAGGAAKDSTEFGQRQELFSTVLSPGRPAGPICGSWASELWTQLALTAGFRKR